MTTFTFERTGGFQTLFIFCEVEPHHPCMPPSLKYFINLSKYKNGNSINFHNFRHTLQTMIQHIYNTLPLQCMNIVQVLSWNFQYGARCARMQRNILKKRTWLVEAKLASSKWTNHQLRTVWSLVFAFSVLPACSRVPLFQQEWKFCLGYLQLQFNCFEPPAHFKLNITLEFPFHTHSSHISNYLIPSTQHYNLIRSINPYIL